MKAEQHPTGRWFEVVGPQRRHVAARRNVRVELLTVQADFREAEAFATAFGKQTLAMTGQIRAQQASNYKKAQAEIDHLQNLAQAEELAYRGRYEMAGAEASLTSDLASAQEAVRRAAAGETVLAPPVALQDRAHRAALQRGRA